MNYLSWILIGFVLFAFTSFCGSSFVCTKGDSRQGLVFDFGKDFGKPWVDIGAYPTFTKNASFVKKIIVDKDRGFLLVSSQKTVHCDNTEEMNKAARAGNPYVPCKGHKLVENYTVRRYIEKKGYEEWSYVPLKEWEQVQNLEHKFNKQPDYIYENCRYQFFGSLYRLIQTIKRI